METFYNPARSEWEGICRRAAQGNEEIQQRVRGILADVRRDGDEAIRRLAREIDKVELSELKVSEEEFAQAEALVREDVKAAIETAYADIYAFHKAEMPVRVELETVPGVLCIQKPVPIRKIGLYIPGGTAPLFSTVLMLAVPSQLAGCPTRVLCTPVGRNGKVSPEVLYAASRCGIRDVYKVGGAQAVAAMAYGTQSIPKVDKIFGPGNRYVTNAKQIVSSEGTAIDMPAGPSEVMVLADESANPAFVAADLLSQAEHGRDSQVILVCTSADIAAKVLEEVRKQTAALPRAELVEGALGNSRVIIFEDTDTILDFADTYAPEHLIISMNNAAELAEKVSCAGSVFIGNFSPESAGDYASGTNHTLPTSGWARTYSGVNMDSFMRKMTLQKLSAAGLKQLSGCIVSMAEAEGLAAHASAVKVRMDAVKDAQPEPFNLEKVVRKNILGLAPYSTARDDYQGSLGIFLDANENPYDNNYNRYPDPRQKTLKARISELKGIPAKNIFLGNGSDEAIDLVYRIFCNPGTNNVVSISPSYGMYRVAAETNDVEFREVRLREDFSLDKEALEAACDASTKAIFICSPNNPSGNAFSTDEILSIARSFHGILVVDEAYIDFSDKGSVVLTEPNILVLQTLSKAWGLAGLRLGLAIADEKIIRIMSMVKYPYNINISAQRIAMDMLKEPVSGKVAELVKERKMLEKILPDIPVVKKVFPSDANFLLVKFDDPNAIYDKLIEAGIIVRNRSTQPLCKGCLRITVGTPEENERLIEILKAL